MPVCRVHCLLPMVGLLHLSSCVSCPRPAALLLLPLPVRGGIRPVADILDIEGVTRSMAGLTGSLSWVTGARGSRVGLVRHECFLLLWQLQGAGAGDVVAGSHAVHAGLRGEPLL